MASINEFKAGLEILSKYFDGDDICGCDAEHDIFYAGHFEEEVEVSDEDKAKLKELGWFEDEESSSWAKYT